jgi:hypothetical protein
MLNSSGMAASERIDQRVIRRPGAAGAAADLPLQSIYPDRHFRFWARSSSSQISGFGSALRRSVAVRRILTFQDVPSILPTNQAGEPSKSRVR